MPHNISPVEYIYIFIYENIFDEGREQNRLDNDVFICFLFYTLKVKSIHLHRQVSLLLSLYSLHGVYTYLLFQL